MPGSVPEGEVENGANAAGAYEEESELDGDQERHFGRLSMHIVLYDDLQTQLRVVKKGNNKQHQHKAVAEGPTQALKVA